MVNENQAKEQLKQDNSEKINLILEKRRPSIGVIENIVEDLSLLKQELHRFEQQKLELLRNLEKDEKEKISTINLTDIFEKLSDEEVEISKLKSRFDRETLNIGVAGRARQGKSTFLQSLTGLASEVIPDGSAGHCTAVKSTIYHKEDIETHGIVDFHTQKSILDEVIKPYYKELELGQKGEELSSLDDFINNFTTVRPSAQSTPLSKAQYNYLKNNYFNSYNEYKNLIGKESLDKITEQKIRSYVARQSRDGKQKYYNHLAVKNVEIYCNFTNKDVGKIALVDMPGLGDTGINSENNMIKSLAYGVDFVLFIKKPVYSGDDWMDVDFTLHDVAGKALDDRLPIEKWSFMILNKEQHKNGDGYINESNCERLKREMPPSIKVADVIIANCANQKEVNELVLNKVLNYLTENIQKLDQEYIQSCEAGLRELKKKINGLIVRARSALKNSFDGHSYFTDEISKVLKSLASGLEKLRKDSKKIYDKQHANFKQYVEGLIQESRDSVINKIIPNNDLDKIREDAESIGGADSYTRVYLLYLAQLRSQLAKDFLAIDLELQKTVLSFKEQIIASLKSMGMLDKISNRSGNEFIEAILQRIDDISIEKNDSDLYTGFLYLKNFDVSSAGIVQIKLREIVDQLEPDNDNFKIQTFVEYSNNKISNEVVSKVIELVNNSVGDNRPPKISDIPSVDNVVDALLKDIKEATGNVLPTSTIKTAAQITIGIIKNLIQNGSNNILSQDEINKEMNNKSWIVREALRSRSIDAINHSHETVDSIYTLPNQISYLIIREFVDRVLRAKDVSNEWRKFYWRNGSLVWPTLSKLKSMRGATKEWDETLDKLQRISNFPSLELLKHYS